MNPLSGEMPRAHQYGQVLIQLQVTAAPSHIATPCLAGWRVMGVATRFSAHIGGKDIRRSMSLT